MDSRLPAFREAMSSATGRQLHSYTVEMQYMAQMSKRRGPDMS